MEATIRMLVPGMLMFRGSIISRLATVPDHNCRMRRGRLHHGLRMRVVGQQTKTGQYELNGKQTRQQTRYISEISLVRTHGPQDKPAFVNVQ